MFRDNVLKIIAITAATILSSNAKIYESSSRQVDFTLEYLDKTGFSQKACVALLKGFEDTNYKKACFATIRNERGVLTECDVSFDDTKCNDCFVCETQGLVGFTLDCYNIQPEENVFVCKTFTNSTIQEVLVDEYFAKTQFDFDLKESTTSSNKSNACPALRGYLWSMVSVTLLAITYL